MLVVVLWLVVMFVVTLRTVIWLPQLGELPHCAAYMEKTPRGGDSQMEQTRMLVGNFEFSP